MPQHHLPGLNSDQDLIRVVLQALVPPPDKQGGIEVTLAMETRGTPLTTYFLNRLVGLETDLLPTMFEDVGSAFLVGETARSCHKAIIVNHKAARAHRKRFERL